MIIWINGAFGAGKTSVTKHLLEKVSDASVFDPEDIGYVIQKTFPEAAAQLAVHWDGDPKAWLSVWIDLDDDGRWRDSEKVLTEASLAGTMSPVSVTRATPPPIDRIQERRDRLAVVGRRRTVDGALGLVGEGVVQTTDARAVDIALHPRQRDRRPVGDVAREGERLGLEIVRRYHALGDPERVKFLRRIHLRTQGDYGTLYVRAASHTPPTRYSPLSA